MAALRDAAEQAWLAQQQSATDAARAFLGTVLAPFDVTVLTVADVRVGEDHRLVVFTDGEVHVAVREAAASEAFLVHAEGDRWVIDSQVTSLAGLYEVLPPAPEPTVPPWEPGIAVNVGQTYTYGGKVYEVIQAHTTQADWTPDVTPSLWTKVA